MSLSLKRHSDDDIVVGRNGRLGNQQNEYTLCAMTTGLVPCNWEVREADTKIHRVESRLPGAEIVLLEQLVLTRANVWSRRLRYGGVGFASGLTSVVDGSLDGKGEGHTALFGPI
jgi:hypothetical protein